MSARASPGLLPVSNGSTLGKIIPAKSPPPPPHSTQLATNSRKPDLRVITSQSGKGLMHHLVSSAAWHCQGAWHQRGFGTGTSSPLCRWELGGFPFAFPFAPNPLRVPNGAHEWHPACDARPGPPSSRQTRGAAAVGEGSGLMVPLGFLPVPVRADGGSPGSGE